MQEAVGLSGVIQTMLYSGETVIYKFTLCLQCMFFGRRTLKIGSSFYLRVLQFADVYKRG